MGAHHRGKRDYVSNCPFCGTDFPGTGTCRHCNGFLISSDRMSVERRYGLRARPGQHRAAGRVTLLRLRIAYAMMGLWLLLRGYEVNAESTGQPRGRRGDHSYPCAAEGIESAGRLTAATRSRVLV